MVTWLADANVQGYISGSAPSLTAYHLLKDTAAPQDLGDDGITRLGTGAVPGLPLSSPLRTVANRIRVDNIRLRFEAWEVPSTTSTRRNPRLHASLYLCMASDVSENPTNHEIYRASLSYPQFHSSLYLTAAGDLLAATVGPGPTSDSFFLANTKYWALVLPTVSTEQYLSGTAGPIGWVRRAPAPLQTTSSWINSNGRAITLWSNRPPAAPTISLSSGSSLVSPDSTVVLTLDDEDPDESGVGGDYRRRDFAGVQVQYSAQPTLDNPDPDWLDLPFAHKAGWSGGPGLGNGWYITQSSASNSSRDGVHTLWSTGSVNIRCGDNALLDGAGVLPSGSWRVRARTFDFGHPFPGSSEAPPIGRANATPTNFTSANASPWSEPALITILGQTLPPVLLSPVGGRAIPESPSVELSWQHRNVVGYGQKARRVEIRERGDTAWTVLADGLAATSTFTVSNVPVSGFSFLDDGTSTTGWTLGGASFQTVVGPSASAFWGIPCVTFEITQTDFVDGWGYVEATRAIAGVPSGGVKTVHISGFRANGENRFMRPVTATLRDGGTPIAATLVSNYGDTTQVPPGQLAYTNWDLTFEVPDGVKFDDILFEFWSQEWDATVPFYFWVDEIEITTLTYPIFPLSATTEYEWRVQTTDTDDEISNFSEIGRFWVVPQPMSGSILPTPQAGVEQGTLGCGTHRVEVFRRGGKDRVGEITSLSSVEWNRVRDDISTAKIVVSGWDQDCGAVLAQLQTWAYEVVITRDNGVSQDRVWEGPITALTYEKDSVTIGARDVGVYLYRRIIKQAVNTMAGTTPVTSIAAQIVQDCLAPDDPNVLAYLRLHQTPDDPRALRYIPPFTRTAFEEIDDMASNAGLDYTAVGRSIILWSTRTPLGVLPEFRDEDLGASPIVSEYGMSMANLYSVSDGNGLFGFAVAPGSGLTKNGSLVSGNDETYGLVEILSSSWAAESETDSGTFTAEQRQRAIEKFEAASERSIEDRYPPPVVVRIPDNTTLNPGAVISIQHLVPGVAIPLRSVSTLREVRATQKLDSVRVVETGGKESISITLSPFSRADDAVEGGEEE